MLLWLCFVDQVERCLRGPAEAGEAAAFYHRPDASFPRLGAQGQSDLLIEGVRDTEKGRACVKGTPDRVEVLLYPVTGPWLDDHRAKELYCEGLILQRHQGFLVVTPDAIEGLAAVAQHEGQPERAARLCGAAEALRETLGMARWFIYQTVYDRTVATTRTQLEEASWRDAWAGGGAMSLEQAVDYALGDDGAM